MPTVYLCISSVVVESHINKWLCEEFKVESTENCSDLMELVSDNPPESIILDIKSTNNRTVELLNELRSYKDLDSINIVLIGDIAGDLSKRLKLTYDNLELVNYSELSRHKLNSVLTVNK